MQNLVLALVIIISIWAHVWIFLFMRFKIDEGVILRFMADNVDAEQSLGIEELSRATSINKKRTQKVVYKSKSLFLDNGSKVNLIAH